MAMKNLLNASMCDTGYAIECEMEDLYNFRVEWVLEFLTLFFLSYL